MSRDDLATAFFASLPGGRFGHREHLRLTWLVLAESPLDEATERVGAAIHEYAASQGAARKYHRTLTGFWVRLVDHARRARPEIRDFDAFLDAFPLLLDKGLAGRHWSDGALWNDDARTVWREPDLRPLPA